MKTIFKKLKVFSTILILICAIGSFAFAQEARNTLCEEKIQKWDEYKVKFWFLI